MFIIELKKRYVCSIVLSCAVYLFLSCAVYLFLSCAVYLFCPVFLENDIIDEDVIYRNNKDAHNGPVLLI